MINFMIRIHIITEHSFAFVDWYSTSLRRHAHAHFQFHIDALTWRSFTTIINNNATCHLVLATRWPHKHGWTMLDQFNDRQFLINNMILQKGAGPWHVYDRLSLLPVNRCVLRCDVLLFSPWQNFRFRFKNYTKFEVPSCRHTFHSIQNWWRNFNL